MKLYERDRLSFYGQSDSNVSYSHRGASCQDLLPLVGDINLMKQGDTFVPASVSVACSER